MHSPSRCSKAELVLKAIDEALPLFRHFGWSRRSGRWRGIDLAMAPLLLATVTTTLRLDLFIVPRPGFDELTAPYDVAQVAPQRPATHGKAARNGSPSKSMRRSVGVKGVTTSSPHLQQPLCPYGSATLSAINKRTRQATSTDDR